MHKLLLADDSVTIQRVIELTFSGEDVQVVAVNDGEQAIARIPLEHPDVVLADIGMPRKGGYDVAAFVKGRPDLAHIPVLLLAGAFEPVDQARAEQVRADGVLIKPFEPRQVIERVKELLAAGQHRRADHTSPIIEGSLAHPVVDVVEAPAPTLSAPPATPPPAVDSGQTLDELFESLNQALSASTKPPVEVVAPEPAAPVVTPAVVAPPAIPELTPPAPAPAVDREAQIAAISFEPLIVKPGPAGSLDDYFDRLSAAFTQSKPATPQTPLPDRFADALGAHAEPHALGDAATAPSQPGLDASGPPQEWLTLPPPVQPEASASRHHERQGSNPILDAVTTLLAQPPWHSRRTEDRTAAPVNGSFESMFKAPVPEIAAPTPAPAADGQDIVDAVTERVLAKLAPAVAESLRQIAQQEIERSRHGGR